MPETIDRGNAESVHDEIIRRLAAESEVVLDMSRVTRADAFGAAAIIRAYRVAGENGRRLRLQNTSDELRRLFAFLRVDRVLSDEDAPERRAGFFESLGAWGIGMGNRAVRQASLHIDGLSLTFIGPFRGRGPRLKQFLHQLNAIGADSVGIVALISFLIGLIMALQAAYQLRQFGANIYVANLVGVSMTRELGPLLTAIVVAARSGSSIAAELGTMVVTEEVDALRVMAIDPKRFLVAPRFAAMALALPCLVILADISGIAGGFAVGVFGLDLGPVHYWNQTVQALYLTDVASGLLKAFIFANVIAIVACNQGLGLRGGPEEVGRATTRAVVWSIVLVIISDFLFTIIFYLLD